MRPQIVIWFAPLLNGAQMNQSRSRSPEEPLACPGRHGGPACALILYVVRLAVRVEGFLLFLVRHAEWREARSAAAAPCGWGWASVTRGMPAPYASFFI